MVLEVIFNKFYKINMYILSQTVYIYRKFNNTNQTANKTISNIRFKKPYIMVLQRE